MPEEQEKARLHIFVSGKVQGVCFRATAQLKAKALDLTGWVRNLTDGRVEGVFEGPKDKIKIMLGWLRQGSFLARVDNLDFQFENYRAEFKNFKIQR